jgi:hypothetical protein
MVQWGMPWNTVSGFRPWDAMRVSESCCRSVRISHDAESCCGIYIVRDAYGEGRCGSASYAMGWCLDISRDDKSCHRTLSQTVGQRGIDVMRCQVTSLVNDGCRVTPSHDMGCQWTLQDVAGHQVTPCDATGNDHTSEENHLILFLMNLCGKIPT